LVCFVWCRAATDIGHRETLQERGGATSTEGSQSQASFFYGELLVVEQHYRVSWQARNPCFPCSSIGARDVRKCVARRGKFGAERPEQFSIDEAKQEVAHVSLRWTRGDDLSGGDVEEECVC
jgi:hypothetical protein